MPNYDKVLKNILNAYGQVSYHLPGGFALPPIHYVLLVTRSCNLRCSMCHYIDFLDKGKRPDELNTEEMLGVIRQIPSFGLVTFSGGEPLMRKDAIQLLTAASNRCRCHLITNGTMLTDEKAEAIVKLGSGSLFGKGLVMVGFSLEGGRETHERIVNRPGSYDKTNAAIARLVAAREASGNRYPRTHVTVVIGENNVDELFDVYRRTCELGVDVCNFVIKNMSVFVHYLHEGGGQEGLMTAPPPVDFIETGRLTAQFDKIFAESRKTNTQVRLSPLPYEEMLKYYSHRLTPEDYSCRYPWRKVEIFSNGDVLGCYYFSFGNIRDDSLRSIWNNREYREFRKRIKSMKTFPGCLGCCHMEYMD